MRTLFIWVFLCGLFASGFAHPNHPSDSLSSAANQAYTEGKWSECAALYAEAVEHGVKDPGTIYNCACCNAKAGNKDAAFAWLDSAIVRDFTNVQHLKRDPDFTGLHGDSRWLPIVEKMASAQHEYLRREGMNAELFFLMKDDQMERMLAPDSLSWDTVAKHDKSRLARVRELVDAKALKVSEDYFNAALIAQHGMDSAAYKMAHELAMRSVELDSANGTAKWLACATQDRYLHSIGKPQIWGTQFRFDSGRWTMEPMDTTAVTDIDRAKWNVPSLAEARSQCDQYNQPEK